MKGVPSEPGRPKMTLRVAKRILARGSIEMIQPAAEATRPEIVMTNRASREWLLRGF